MLRNRVIVKYLGHILLFNALFLFIAAMISLVYGETSLKALLISALSCAVLGFFPSRYIKGTDNLRFQEGLVISVSGWFLTCIAGMVPYVIWGSEFTLANAFFESVSGFTTTGASILNNVEALPMGLLFWRSSTSFIGGVGIILFVLLVLPEKRGVQFSFYRAEVSELSKMTFRTRSRHIIQIIASVYFILIITETILLKILGMSFFEAICHSFSTVATSGFSTRNLSIAAYDNVWIEMIITFFMLISSMHFGLVYATIVGKKQNLFTSRPSRMYMIVVAIGILLISLQLFHTKQYNLTDSFRYAAFQVVSLTSTTGLVTADTSLWPLFSCIVLVYFSFQCGMVGSTSGGIKFERIYLFFHSVGKQLKLILHPNAVYVVRMNNKVINHELELQVMVFIFLYIVTFFITALLLSLMGIDGTTAFSASFATIGNVGPGFGDVKFFWELLRNA